MDCSDGTARSAPETFSSFEAAVFFLFVQLVSDRITFLSIDNMGISFYRQITLGATKFITGLRVMDEVMLLTSKQWSVEQELGRTEVAYVTLSQLIDNVYFTYPDFSKKLQAGLRYRFLPLVTGMLHCGAATPAGLQNSSTSGC